MNSALKHLRVQLHSLHLSTEQHKEVLEMIEEAYDIGNERGWDSRDEAQYFVSSVPH